MSLSLTSLTACLQPIATCIEALRHSQRGRERHTHTHAQWHYSLTSIVYVFIYVCACACICLCIIYLTKIVGVCVYRDGTRVIEFPNGSKETVSPNGNKILTRASGLLER
jgi:hypothetical protein